MDHFYSVFNRILKHIGFLLDFVIHIDKHLARLFHQYGLRVYAIIFGVIFIETGFVVMPFLPGDSLLFASGALAGNPMNHINVHILWLLIFVAAILGDSLNYEIGKFIGPKIFKMKSKRIKQEYLEKTQHFYEKYWGKAIVYARFVPIVRTFAPFVAGIGNMKYTSFLHYNLLWAFLWSASLVYAGFFFGTIPIIQEHFSFLIIWIIILSNLPVLIERYRHHRDTKKAKQESPKNSAEKIEEK